MLRPARALLHPLWLASLALYALNDHVLKGAALLPQWATGKLSDVCVLLVTPIVLATLLGVRTRRGLVIAHAAMGALFVSLELSPTFTAWWTVAIGWLGFRWVTWSDWTDLLTLPALGVSLSVLGRAAARPTRDPTVPRRMVEAASVAAAAYVCLATSDVDCPQAEVVDPDADADGAAWSRDCDDEDAGRSPFLAEVDGDGIDQDCDGYDGMRTEVPGPCDDAIGLALDTPLDIDTSQGATRAGPSCVPGNGPSVRLAVSANAYPNAAVGWLTVRTDAAAPHAVAVDTMCPGEGLELVCAAPPASDLRVLVRSYAAAYVTIRATGGGGPVRVVAHFDPLLCGDGITVLPEACDDANLVGGDGCDPTCRVEGTDT